MKYDFTTVIDRAGHDCEAVDGVGSGGAAPMPPKDGFDFIPMWVADMSFAVCPEVIGAMAKRLEHPVFGYFPTPDSYYDAIIRWHARHKGVTDLEPGHIGYENGVLGGVVSAANILCSKGDKILVHSPTYVGFTGSLTNCGYELVHSALVPDEEGVWRMDYADMERKLRDQHIHTMILCSPHNPTGRVWQRWELEQAMELCKKYDVNVISDEIWSDIILPGHTHIPTQSVSHDAKQRTIALYAPSKTFNLAGLVGSYHVIYNKRLKDRMDKEGSLSHYNAMNVLSLHALLGAYTQGDQWLEELLQVLEENVDYAVTFIRKQLPGVTVAKPQGTYMLFLDCEQWCRDRDMTMDELLQAGWDVGVGWQDGRKFHGPWHIRLNLALPKSRLMEAMERLQRYVFV